MNNKHLLNHRIFADIEIFNLGSKLWRAGGLIKEPRNYAAVYFFENKLTVFGGNEVHSVFGSFYPYILFQGQNLAYFKKSSCFHTLLFLLYAKC